MYIEFKNISRTLTPDEQLILLDALGALIDCYHWAGQSDSEKGDMVMKLYQEFGGEILLYDDSEDDAD